MDEILEKKKQYHENLKCHCGLNNYYLCSCNYINGILDPKPIEIMEGLFLGSYKYAFDSKFLNENNIEFVLNCAEEYYRYTNEDLLDNINYLTLNAYDFNNYPIIQYHGIQALEFIETALMLGSNVYIHCQMGINRSASLLAYVIHRLFNKTIKESILLILEKRPICFTNKTYIQQLLEIEEGKILI
jgi:hypothetical protein